MTTDLRMRCVGDLIANKTKQKAWQDFVGALIDAAAPGGPLEGWAFHGTDGLAAFTISDEGLRETNCIVPTGPNDWIESEGVHWGSPAVAAFFAEDRIESTQDPDLDLVIFAARLDDIHRLGPVVADGAMIDVPLYSRLALPRSEVDAHIHRWLDMPSPITWMDSWEVLETLIVQAPVPTQLLFKLESEDDVRSLIEMNCRSRTNLHESNFG